MGKYFGTDGIRGVANVQLTAEIAFKIGQYLGYYFKKETRHARVVIGKDTRLSKDMLEAALCAGLTTTGAHVDLLGVTSTPNVAFATKTNHYDCGIMISASHNPYYDNGIKIFNKHGHKLENEIELLIEDYIDGKSQVELAKKDELGLVRHNENAIAAYLEHLKMSLTIDVSNVKVALDCANGSVSSIAQQLFSSLDMEVLTINDRPNGVNINVDCGSTHPEKLCRFVVENNCDLGLAFDGDADRVIAVDNRGHIVDGDLILYIIGSHLKELGKLANDTIVTTVMSNIGLYLALDAKGIKYEKTAVGDKYVFENMNQNGHNLGGEQSGHVILSDFASTGDGMLTGLQLIEAIIVANKTLAELAAEVKIFPQLLKNIKVKDKNSALNDKDILALIETVEEKLGKEGRVLVRPSGTEPLVRVMVEAKTSNLCKYYVNEFITLIEEKGL